MIILIRLLSIGIFTLSTLNIFSQENYNKIDDKNILINGKLDFFAKKRDLIKYLGKADNLEKFQPECGSYAEFDTSTKFQFYTKKFITYIIYNNEADFDEIDLVKDTTNFMNFKAFRISHKTTINDLKKIFPNSYKEFKKENSGTFRLLFDLKDCDDQIQIGIKNNKVISIGYWTPC